jgi:large subunit ribosomal protein L30
MAKLRITQTRSAIGQSQRHRGTLRALGLGKIGRSAEHMDRPELAGMLRKVRHLVRVEESDGVSGKKQRSRKATQPGDRAETGRSRTRSEASEPTGDG